MAYDGSFGVNICEKDSDSEYENLGETFFKEPAFNAQGGPEVILMGRFTERSDTSDSESTNSSERSKESFNRKKECSAARQRVLSSHSTGLHSSAGTSIRGRRTPAVQRHQTSSRDSFHTPRVTKHGTIQSALEETSTEGLGCIERNKEELASDLQGLPVNEGMHKLRAMPLSLVDKMEIRRRSFSASAVNSLNRNFPCFNLPSVYISRMWRHCTFNALPFLSSLKLWHSSMKKLSGRYGTGVLSYFLFLRTLLFINLLLFVITCLFLVIPQAIHPPPPPRLNSVTAIELLTGTGYLSQSLMFYGYYSNITIETNQMSSHSAVTHMVPYCIPTAYFFTITISFFIICIILVYSVSKSFGKSFRVLKSISNLSEKVFCSWDFKVSKKSSIRLQCEKISTQLKEQLSELTSRVKERSPWQRFWDLIAHVLAWLTCLVSILLCAIGVYFLSKHTVSSEFKHLDLLFTSAVVSGFNLLLPGIFNLCSWMEKHNSPSTRVYVSIFRNLLLKISIIGMLCYHWLGKIAVKQDRQVSECWENFVGQELYRLLLMDFIFTVLYTFLGEFIWRIFSKKVLKKNRKPVFDIARNVLELIYGQTLTWLGVLFSPLLPAVQIAKLFVLFYMKKSSLMLNCQASKNPWRASQMTTLFITLLCFPSFVGAAVSVLYTVWMIKPSSGCGPFRNLTNMFQSGKSWAERMKDSHKILSWLIRAYNTVIDNPLFLFLPTCVFLLVIYFHAQVVDGQRKIIKQLEKQIENEVKDKQFLITLLQPLKEENNPESTQR